MGSDGAGAVTSDGADGIGASGEPGLPITADVVGAVVREPAVWGAALVAAGRHLPTGWWRGGARRRADPWLRFRMETAYGNERTAPTSSDAVTWLRWLRAWPRARH